MIALAGLSACGLDTAPDGGGAADAEWKVVATSVGDRKILAIKVIREITGLGLKEAKDLAESVPGVVISGVPKNEADAAAKKLREAGVTVKVEPK